MSDRLTVNGMTLQGLLDFHRTTFGCARMEDPPPPAEGEAGGEQPPTTFTQADVDRIVRERVQRERAKFADYDDLKKKAGQTVTAEQRIAALEEQVTTAQREALKRRVQAAYSISDEDADLFLTGPDEAALTAQAKRLADRESDRQKKHGNVVPTEGNPPPPPANDELRGFTRKLFASGE